MFQVGSSRQRFCLLLEKFLCFSGFFLELAQIRERVVIFKKAWGGENGFLKKK